MIRILLADDHAVVREGLRQLFAYAPDMELCAEFAGGDALLAGLADGGVGFDVLLLDLSMPGLSGVELLQRLRARFPRLPVLVLSMHNEVVVAQRAMAAGAAGFLTKDSDPEALLEAIRRVAAGLRVMDGGLAGVQSLDGLEGGGLPALLRRPS